MITRLGSLLLACAFSMVANADLVVSTDAPSGAPLVLQAGDVGVGTMTVSVASDSSDDVTGYQVGLRIVPQGGAVGAVSFSAASPAASNYIFTSPNDFAQNVFGSGDLAALDDVSTAVTVTTAVNLVDLTFDVSAGSRGFFDVVLINSSPAVTEFVNGVSQVAFGPSGGTAIGVISAVPEPSAFLFGSVVVSLIAGAAVWHCKRTAAS